TPVDNPHAALAEALQHLVASVQLPPDERIGGIERLSDHEPRLYIVVASPGPNCTGSSCQAVRCRYRMVVGFMQSRGAPAGGGRGRTPRTRSRPSSGRPAAGTA